MLEGHLHDREQGQQHLIQLVKLVYYSPALFFTWSINYSQYVRSKNTVHRKRNMFTGPQTEMPQLFTMVVALQVPFASTSTWAQ